MNITQFPDDTKVVNLKAQSYQVKEFFGEMRLELRDEKGNKLRISFKTNKDFAAFLSDLSDPQNVKLVA